MEFLAVWGEAANPLLEQIADDWITPGIVFVNSWFLEDGPVG